MRMSGQTLLAESVATITEAVVLPHKISIDFTDSDGAGHMEATSDDQFLYRGTYGYPQLDPHCHVEMEMYRAHHGRDSLLVGKWWNATTGSQGTWAIKLTREAE